MVVICSFLLVVFFGDSSSIMDNGFSSLIYPTAEDEEDPDSDEWRELDSDDEEVDEIWSNMMKVVFDDDDDGVVDNVDQHHSLRQPRGPRQRICYIADDGSSVPMTPRMMLWYNMYIAHPKLECAHFQRKFRMHF